MASTPLLPYVLVVDDDDDSLTISQLTLDWAGIPAKTVSSAAEALTLAIAEPPAVALVDLNMPVMSGVSLLRALRADPQTEHTAAVALTGVPEMLDTVSDVQFDWVLTKPVPPEQLIRIIRALLAVSDIRP